MNATCGQIKPILQKLEKHFTVKHEDKFMASIKEKVWENLSERYQRTFKPSCMRPQQWTPDLKGGW
jgi:hypothetical protein